MDGTKKINRTELSPRERRNKEGKKERRNKKQKEEEFLNYKRVGLVVEV
jgi:hypothetical protein